MVTLLCTVRQCRQPLSREKRRFVCARGHSFDLARSGYCNLLQPQDRRSANPGDSPTAVAARRRFLDAGHADPLTAAILAAAAAAPPGALLEAGCGEGHHLAAIQSATGAESHGLDISVPAIDAAARRYRDCHWVVANADRFLPYADRSFALIMSITSRLNNEEFRRVIREDGLLVVAIPAPDDLLELRTAILGEGEQRDRVERTVATFAEGFFFQSQQRAQHRTTLDRQSIIDVMTSSYRGLRTRQRERLETIDSMEVTLARDVLSFRVKTAVHFGATVPPL